MKDVIEDSLTKQIIDKIFPTIKEEALKECSGIVKDLTKNITRVVVEQNQIPVRETTQVTHYKFKDILLVIIFLQC